MFRSAPGEDALDLRDDGKRNFLWRFCGEMQTGRREELRVHFRPAIDQVEQNFFPPFTRPNKSDITQPEWEQNAKRGAIAAEVVGGDDDGAVLIRQLGQLRDGLDYERFPT